MGSGPPATLDRLDPYDFLSKAYTPRAHETLPFPQYRSYVEALQKNLANASEIIFITDTLGLGDAIILAPWAPVIANALDKPVICQVPAGLHEVFNTSSCTFSERISPQQLGDPNTFILSLGTFSIIQSRIGRWLDNTTPHQLYSTSPYIQYQQILKEKIKTGNFFDIANGFANSYQQYLERHHIFEQNTSSTDTVSAAILYSLGISMEQLSKQPLIELRDIPMPEQGIDILLLPDALESPESHARPSRSSKSLSDSVWKNVFGHWYEKNPHLRLGIVIGTAHPDLCERVLNHAQQIFENGSIHRIQGCLPHIAQNMLRAYNIIGMDSGTTKLAKEVVLGAQRAGRTIQLLEIFNAFIANPRQYAITETGTTFVYPGSWEDIDVLDKTASVLGIDINMKRQAQDISHIPLPELLNFFDKNLYAPSQYT